LSGIGALKHNKYEQPSTTNNKMKKQKKKQKKNKQKKTNKSMVCIQ